MSINDGLRQASVRAATGTALDYTGDWHALFDQAGIPPGLFNGRMLAWVNAQLSATHTEINGALDAFAISQGAPDWSSLGTFNIGAVTYTPSLDFSDANNSQYFPLFVVVGASGTSSADFSQSSNSMYVPALAA